MTQTNENPKLFIVLLIVSLGSFLLLAVVLSFVSQFGTFVLIGTLGIVTFGGILLLGLLLALKQHQLVPFFEKPISLMILMLYPVALKIGTLGGKEKDEIRASFISIHNRLAKIRKITADPDKILVLLPHCLQWSDCPHKVTTAVTNCKECGRCTLTDLLALQRQYGFHISVATGGTLARRKIQELRPKIVIAVACERDLASGIQDVQQIHVLGVTNERPFGPCFNTSVDLEELEQTVLHVIR